MGEKTRFQGVRGITCCNGCVAPKRHIGCHVTCKDYNDQKAEFEEKKEKIKQAYNETPKLTNYDYDKFSYAGKKYHKS